MSGINKIFLCYFLKFKDEKWKIFVEFKYKNVVSVQHEEGQYAWQIWDP